MLLVGVLVAACGSGSAVSWRGLELSLPQGWVVADKADTRMMLADAPLGEQAGDRGDRTVAVQLTHEPGTSVSDWRDFVAQQDGTIETDESTTVGGRPAHRLVYTFDANGIRTREMVVVVPSRSIVVLLQPVAADGQTDAPGVFLQGRGTFDDIIASISFGAPPRQQR